MLMSGIRYKLIIGLIIILPCLLIIAFSVHAQESFLNEPSFDSPPIESSNPITPSILTIINITSSSTTLTWTKNTDTDFAYYDLYRIISFEPLNVIRLKRIYNQDETTFTDTLPQGTAYYYTLRTYNQTGQFSRSNSLGALYVPYKNITIDGSISDWSGLTSSIRDYTNDEQPGSPSGTDISNVYLAYNDQYFYARMDLADASPNTSAIVYYSLSFDSQQAGHSIGDRYLYSSFFPSPEQNQSVLRQRTSIDPHQAITIAMDIAASGPNTLEMRTPIDKVIEKLKNGLLHFYVAVSAVPGAVGYYDGTIQIAMKIPKIYPDKAVSLAKEVLGAPYLGDGETWGGKGEDCSVWKPQDQGGGKRFVSPSEITTTGYYYYDNRAETKDCSSVKDEKGKGLDCSGLTFWSYNRAYFGGELFTSGEYKDRPLLYEKASEQQAGNTISINKNDLKAGDLLFFDIYSNDGIIDHVAMYIGGATNNVIHASLSASKITFATYDPATEKLTTIKPTGEPDVQKVKVYGRVTDPKTGFKATANSKVDLIITDPDGFVTTRENPWGYPMEYQIYDIDGDGKLDDIIIGSERKIGDYLIQAVSEPDALPTDTYTLTIEALVNGITVTKILAEDALISDIPNVPYILRSTESEIEKIIPAKAKIEPETLNLDQKGVFTAFIEFSKGFGVSVTDIDPQTVTIQGISAVKTSIAKDKFIAKFQTQDLVNITPGEKVEFKVAGKLKDGTTFEGIDIIRVIRKGSLAELSSLLANLHEVLSQLSKMLQMLQ